MYSDLLEWLEDFITMLESAETPYAYDPNMNVYNIGYNTGCKDAQEAILQRLRYAVEAERAIGKYADIREG